MPHSGKTSALVFLCVAFFSLKPAIADIFPVSPSPSPSPAVSGAPVQSPIMRIRSGLTADASGTQTLPTGNYLAVVNPDQRLAFMRRHGLNDLPADQIDRLILSEFSNIKYEYGSSAESIQGLFRVRIEQERELPMNELFRFERDPELSYRSPNDPYFAGQWGLRNQGQSLSAFGIDGPPGISGVDVRAEDAWDLISNPSTSVIAIYDSGIDLTHADLQDNVWMNASEFNGTAGVDDDDNGYIDDYIGANTTEHNGAVYDSNGHGTQVAGIAVAQGNNGIGIAGVSWNTKVMTLTSDRPTVGHMIEALEYAIDQKRRFDRGEGGANVRVFNLSSGVVKSCNPAQSVVAEQFLKVVADARSVGILVIGSAQNRSIDHDLSQNLDIPAGCQASNLLIVTALNRFGTLSSFAGFGQQHVGIAAPGEDIVSTTNLNGYTVVSGTSFAAPFVAGAAALLFENDRSITPDRVREQLELHARKIPALQDKLKSGGLLDIAATLDAVLVRSLTPWHRESNPLDVNGDGLITPIDVLMIINYLNSDAGKEGALASGPPPDGAYLDVSGDNYVTPVDALYIINELNR